MPEIVIELTEKQTLFDRTIKKTVNTFYGGAKGGGKSHGLREIMLKRRIETPYSRGVIFRKTYPELYNNHIKPLLSKFPILEKMYNRTNNEITLPNKSVLMFRHCHHENDLKDHDGVEYDDLAIEEAGDWPEHWFWRLKGCNRSSIPGISPRTLLTGNPGGIGHKWLKRLFVERKFREIENPDDFAFVPARLKDNPALMANNPSYENTLRSNKNPLLVKAFVDGSWDIQAGQFFDMVSRETHMIKPFEIPDHWERMGMFDTGYNHPAGFVWLAMDTDGNCYAYREYLKNKRRTEEIVDDLMIFPDTKSLKAVPAGHDCWVKHSGAPSVEEKFSDRSQHKLILHKAAIDRIAGAQQVRDYLVLRDTGEVDANGNKIMRPRLLIFDTCPMLFETIVKMTHDPDRVEDVLKVDADAEDPLSGDDLYDAIRMGLMDRPRISTTPPEQKRRGYFKNEDQDSTPSWTTV